MKLARFIIDTHVHAQRHAVKAKARVEKGEKVNYSKLPELYREAVVYDNSPRLLYDMQCYGVDMCIIQPAFGFTNDLNVEIMKKHPDKFVCLCNAREEEARAKGFTGEWNADAAALELDRLLGTGNFVGIGEGVPLFEMPRDISWVERRKELEKFFDIAAKYKVPISWHASYLPVGYIGGGLMRMTPDMLDPMHIHDVASEYPDVTIVVQHGGMEGWWGEWMVERCCHVAASHENVYLEVGMYWAELLIKPISDPNIGPEKLVWGTDWGASHVVYAQPKQYPSSYITQVRTWGIPAHQPDYWGWCLRQILKLTLKYDISQDDLNLIMGGNAVRIWKLQDKVPHKRLFKEYVKL